jgi:hypothetical protein
VPKYLRSDRLALAWSNCMMLWSIGLSLLVVVLRRLPGKPKPAGAATAVGRTAEVAMNGVLPVVIKKG